MVFPLAFCLIQTIDKTIGLRVSPEEEMEGLDIGEHGMEAIQILKKYLNKRLE